MNKSIKFVTSLVIFTLITLLIRHHWPLYIYNDSILLSNTCIPDLSLVRNNRDVIKGGIYYAMDKCREQEGFKYRVIKLIDNDLYFSVFNLSNSEANFKMNLLSGHISEAFSFPVDMFVDTKKHNYISGSNIKHKICGWECSYNYIELVGLPFFQPKNIYVNEPDKKHSSTGGAGEIDGGMDYFQKDIAFVKFGPAGLRFWSFDGNRLKVIRVVKKDSVLPITMSPKVCDVQTVAVDKDECYLRVATRLANINVCMGISNNKNREWCEYAVRAVKDSEKWRTVQ